MSVLTARGAGVRRRRQWLFRDLDVTVEPGETVAVVGPPGSGRTTVLLALARRFRLSAGRVAVDGAAALGHVPEVSAPEPVFTVAEHVRERLALLGRPLAEAAGVPLRGLPPGRRGSELTPYEKQVLGLILAGLGDPAVIALDGVDDGLDAAEQAELWRLLDEIAAAGTAVLVTAREIDAARVSAVIRLGTEPRIESAAPREAKVRAEVVADPLGEPPPRELERAEAEGEPPVELRVQEPDESGAPEPESTEPEAEVQRAEAEVQTAEAEVQTAEAEVQTAEAVVGNGERR